MNDLDMVTPPDSGMESEIVINEDDVNVAKLARDLLGQGDVEDEVLSKNSVVNNTGVVDTGINVLQQPERETSTEKTEDPGNDFEGTGDLTLSTENHLEMGEFEELELIIASMETDQLIDLSTAIRLNELTKGKLFTEVSEKSFTKDPSRTNITVSLESAKLFKYGAYAIGALAGGYLIYKTLDTMQEMAKSAKSKNDIDVIASAKDIRVKDAKSYDDKVKKLSGHISSGVIRNKRLLETIQKNAERRVRNLNVDVGKDPFKFGNELVNGIWEFKMEKQWCRIHMLTVTSVNFTIVMREYINTYIATLEQLHLKFREFKNNVKSDKVLVMEDYLPRFDKFIDLNSKLEGKYEAKKGEVNYRDPGIEAYIRLNSLMEYDGGFKVYDISKCLTIHADIEDMNKLDRSVYNTASKIQVLTEDTERYIRENMVGNPLQSNRDQIYKELEYCATTLNRNYSALLAYRGKVSGLVRNIRSTFNEASGMWDSIARDQSGRL